MTVNSSLLLFLKEGRLLDEYQTHAHWLKSLYESLKWKIGSHTIYWSRGLPDGSQLSDSCNHLLLASTKRIVFEIRSSPLSRLMNDEHHYRRALMILNILDWMVHNSDRYNPRLFSFSALDTAGLTEFVSLFAWGGPTEVSFIQNRIQREFETVLFNETHVTDNTNNKKIFVPDYINFTNVKNKVVKTFEDPEIKIIKKYLYKNGFYKNTENSCKLKRYGRLNRRKISDFIGLQFANFTPRIDIYLRQFEFIEDYDVVEHVYRFRNCEYIPSNFLVTEESAKQPYSESRLDAMMATLSSLRQLAEVVEGLPAKTVFDCINARSIADRLNLSEKKHHRTTPVPIAMHVMNEAIRFILTYGDPLVEYLIAFGRKAYEKQQYENIRPFSEEYLLKHPLPEALSPLNISTIKSYYDGRFHGIDGIGKIAAPKVRQAASLEDSINLLLASVYLLTASLSARREIEICSLWIGSVTGSTGFHELEFELAKANFEDERVVISRPIPDLLAKSLNLVQSLTIKWTELFGIDDNEYLFWIPIELGKGGALRASYIDILLDRFCDFIEIPLDDNGRRWYVRTHECRRFFAIIFFWQFKYANLTALQWMLGHVNPQHTYDYIKENLGGSELTKEEASITAEAIRGSRSDSGIDRLRQLVITHFHSDDVQLIEEDDLELYLESLLEQGLYEIRIHSIETSEGVAYDILFEIHEQE